jgi:hypothetical protein
VSKLLLFLWRFIPKLLRLRLCSGSTWNHTLVRLPRRYTPWVTCPYADKIAKLPRYLGTRIAMRCTTADCASTKTVTAFGHAKAPARAIGVARALLLRRGPSNTRDGRKRAPYEGCSHQPKRLAARDAPACQSTSQFIEVAVASFFAHLCPLSPKGGTRGLAPPSCTTKISMRGYKG